MSNERIDMTQFEDIPKQMEIKWHEHPIYGARYLIKISEPETPWVVGAIVPDFEPYGDYAKDKIEQEKMAKLFAATPDLIAELKRMYEHEKALLNEFQKMSAQIDGLRGILSILEDRHDIDMSQFKDYLASE